MKTRCALSAPVAVTWGTASPSHTGGCGGGGNQPDKNMGKPRHTSGTTKDVFDLKDKAPLGQMSQLGWVFCVMTLVRSMDYLRYRQPGKKV